MYNIENGRYMTPEEVQEALKQAAEQKDFQNFIAEVSIRQPIDVKNLEVKLGYMFDVLEVTPPVVSIVKSLVLQNKEGNVQLNILAFNKAGDTVVNYDFSADYKEEGSVKQYTLNKKLEVSQQPTINIAAIENIGQFEEFDNTVPYNDPNYTPGESLEKLNTKDMSVDGCLPGGYKHCGKNCGNGGRYGGGTPINGVDTCCRAHDRCYEMFGFDKCSCDNTFGDCVRPYKGKYAMATAILAWLRVKSCR
ncbi:hypothetical protein [Bacillus arachidis]|uniref:hypothetical protein n=1 Tax=Bacillus arachidis TaxID=2819290 RepID=UPI00255D0D4D|nr:hypothetical protein [Bacillus arachidis]WIY58990.1 hypothetical protein QRY57_01520 [Bacillus arachidis]